MIDTLKKKKIDAAMKAQAADVTINSKTGSGVDVRVDENPLVTTADIIGSVENVGIVVSTKLTIYCLCADVDFHYVRVLIWHVGVVFARSGVHRSKCRRCCVQDRVCSCFVHLARHQPQPGGTPVQDAPYGRTDQRSDQAGALAQSYE
jgi:hypothetical protein